MFMLGYGTSRYVFESFEGNAIPQVFVYCEPRLGRESGRRDARRGELPPLCSRLDWLHP